eukprot:725228-Amphidinium_carterae.3
MLQRVDNIVGDSAAASSSTDDLGDMEVSPLASNGAARDAMDFFTQDTLLWPLQAIALQQCCVAACFQKIPQEAALGHRACFECESAEVCLASIDTRFSWHVPWDDHSIGNMGKHDLWNQRTLRCVISGDHQGNEPMCALAKQYGKH